MNETAVVLAFIVGWVVVGPLIFWGVLRWRQRQLDLTSLRVVKFADMAPISQEWADDDFRTTTVEAV